MPFAAYPPRDIPDATEYIYPGPTNLSEYLRMTTPLERRRDALERLEPLERSWKPTVLRPVEDVVDIDMWDRLGDFA